MGNIEGPLKEEYHPSGMSVRHVAVSNRPEIRANNNSAFVQFRRLRLRVANGVEQQTESDEDLEKAMEEFLKSQQEKESGRPLLLVIWPLIPMSCPRDQRM